MKTGVFFSIVRFQENKKMQKKIDLDLALTFFTFSLPIYSSSPFLWTAATSHEPFLLPISQRSREKTSVE